MSEPDSKPDLYENPVDILNSERNHNQLNTKENENEQ